MTFALWDAPLFENSTMSPTLNWDLKLDSVEVIVADPAEWPDKIGPEPGNATLTSNTESAVPPPVTNAYCFTSPKPNVVTVLVVATVAPLALFAFNASPVTNVPLVLYK